MKKPCVSIIMSCFNPSDIDALHNTVMSLVKQSLEDWELILYDDGSCEPCAGFIRTAAGLDRRIRYVRSEINHGLAYSLNQCIAIAEGALIARMDDDDLSHPERLEKQVRFLRDHPDAAWVGSQAWLMDANGIWGIHTAPPEPGPKDYLTHSPYIHPSVVFRREALIGAGGYSVSPLTLRCEDYELFMRMTASGLRGYNMPDKLLYYQERRDILTKRSFRNCFCEMLIRFKGFRSLDLFSLRNLPYAVKPMMVWIISLVPGAAQRIRKRYSAGIETYLNEDCYER